MEGGGRSRRAGRHRSSHRLSVETQGSHAVSRSRVPHLHGRPSPRANAAAGLPLEMGDRTELSRRKDGDGHGESSGADGGGSSCNCRIWSGEPCDPPHGGYYAWAQRQRNTTACLAKGGGDSTMHNKSAHWTGTGRTVGKSDRNSFKWLR